jgi:hypothetical protein
LTFNAIDASPYMQSADGSTVVVRLTVKGTQTGSWSARGNRSGAEHSPPLSETRLRAKGAPIATIPACAVFTFDSNNLINEFALYVDRYRLMRDLGGRDLRLAFTLHEERRQHESA